MLVPGLNIGIQVLGLDLGLEAQVFVSVTADRMLCKAAYAHIQNVLSTKLSVTRLVLTQTRLAGTRFIYPGGMEG